MPNSRTRSFAINSVFSMMNQMIVMLSGFIVPRFMLTYYGSEINGLVSSISQFINYFTIVEAGLSGAAIFALYKPLAKNNQLEINKIVSSAKKYYYQAGYLFTGAVIILAIVYPYFVETNSLIRSSIRFLVIMLGAKGFLDFFLLAKYRALLTADQKIYVISLSSSIYTILNTFLISLFAVNRLPITYVYLFSLLPLLVRSMILHFYVKKNYSFINYNISSNEEVLHARWDALFQQFVLMAQNSAPPIIATIFLTLTDVSIYSIYNMIISGLNGVLTIFTTSLSSSFGNVLANDQQKILQKTYHEFEFIYFQLIAVVYSVAASLILPFVSLYTSSVNDTNYTLPIIAILMILNGFLYTIKTPQGMLIIAAGHYKETRWRSLFQAILLIASSLILVNFFGLPGIIMGSILSNLYRVIDMVLYVPKHITKLSVLMTLKNYGFLIVTSLITFLMSNYVLFKSNGWIIWVLNALILTSLSIIVSLITSFLFNKSLIMSLKNRISSFRKVG